MSLHGLAVIFLIIILPISMVLQVYVQAQVKTLSLQTTYDSKLIDATYDALKAYQLNTLNSDTSDVTANVKIRDINASANTFFNTLATGLNEAGVTKTTVKNYVPALVYTMYDGYYIYSEYTNTWDEATNAKFPDGQTKYTNGTQIQGVKPFIYYSCRYVSSNVDVVITYTLDNYITIQGTVNGEAISKQGYLLSGVEKEGDVYKYKGVIFSFTGEEFLEETIYVNGKEKTLPYTKINGTKYYKTDTPIEINGEDYVGFFTVTNGTPIKQTERKTITKDTNAYEYYKKAYELKQYIQGSGLKDLKYTDAVSENGTGKLSEEINENEPQIQTLSNGRRYL